MATLCLLCIGKTALAEDSGPTGTLKVLSTIDSAEVYVDNEPLGPPPITRQLPTGSHTVRVTADFHDPYVRRVDVRDGQTVMVDARLSPGRGTVEFQATPRGATLIINGRDTWPLPVRLRDLAPGRYAYRIDADGHDSARGKFEFKAGRNLLIVEDLQNTTGFLVITSTPPGASVQLNGEPVGQTPLQLTGLPPARHGVRLDLDGYASMFRSVDTSDGAKGEVTGRMRKGGTRIRVKTGHPEAVVSIQDHEIGRGSRVELPRLARGRYRLDVAAPGMEPTHMRMSVSGSGHATFKAHLIEPGGTKHSELNAVPPLFQRWTFWTAIGAGTGVGTVAGILLWNSLQPVAVPNGDVVVSLP